MTNKEFFVQILEKEMPVFIKVIKAVPADKLDFKPDEKARTAGRIAFQLASQWEFVSGVVKTGVPEFGDYAKKEAAAPGVPEMITLAEANFAKLKTDLQAISDEDWENGMGKMVYPGGVWEDKKYNMIWGFLFDAIHHRGQLSTYLRILGAKVPSIYGGSADEQPGA